MMLKCKCKISAQCEQGTQCPDIYCRLLSFYIYRVCCTLFADIMKCLSLIVRHLQKLAGLSNTEQFKCKKVIYFRFISHIVHSIATALVKRM